MQEVVGKIVESHLNIGLALGELFHLVVSSLPPVSLFQTSNNAVGGVLPTVQISTGTPAYSAAVAYSVRTTARYDPPILQLKQPSGPTKLYLGALYGPGAAPITDVTFRPKADGSGPEISIVVPRTSRPGYTLGSSSTATQASRKVRCKSASTERDGEVPKSSVLIYGATGHSGRLIAARARDLGIEAILAGRSAERLEPLGRQLGYRWLAFGLDQPLRIDAALSAATVVVNAAGPFSQTALPLVQACLRTGTHYLDIAGELPVFQRAERHNQQAERLGVMLMPGASFFITATDCLAAHVSRRCPEALYLRIATITIDVPSRGTVRSMIENIHGSVSIREAGALATMRVGRARRQFDFGEGPRWCSAVSAADVVTAWYTTGIRNIEAYASLTPLQASSYELTAMFAAPLRLPPVGHALKAITGLLPKGRRLALRPRRAIFWWRKLKIPGNKFEARD